MRYIPTHTRLDFDAERRKIVVWICIRGRLVALRAQAYGNWVRAKMADFISQRMHIHIARSAVAPTSQAITSERHLPAMAGSAISVHSAKLLRANRTSMRAGGGSL